MGVKPINEIVNESMKIFINKNLDEINDIDNDKTTRKKRVPKVAYTEYLADKLVDIYNAPKSRDFFLKCAWNLSEDTIWAAVEKSRGKRVKKPIALFVFICNNALQELPIKNKRTPTNIN